MEIDYIALFVSDVNLSVTFYREVLGFQFDKPIAQDGTEGLSGSLKIGIYDRIWLAKLFGENQDSALNSHSFLLSMTADHLETTYQHLLQSQIQDLVPNVNPPKMMPWGQKIIFLTDPDGNLLEIVEKRPSS
ncbi:VOC family protein [Tumidithrix helvetica PCC 7403]|uniref:VOC family protein n=1 Tax=Tumidithrix helvetica TaxID=3457545 RepID=UPI003C977EC6